MTDTSREIVVHGIMFEITLRSGQTDVYIGSRDALDEILKAWVGFPVPGSTAWDSVLHVSLRRVNECMDRPVVVIHLDPYQIAQMVEL